MIAVWGKGAVVEGASCRGTLPRGVVAALLSTGREGAPPLKGVKATTIKAATRASLKS